MYTHTYTHINPSKRKGSAQSGAPVFVVGLSRNAQSTGDFGGENLRRQSGVLANPILDWLRAVNRRKNALVNLRLRPFLRSCSCQMCSPVSFITNSNEKEQSRAAAISCTSFSEKLSRLILLERFCRVCLVFSASCESVILRRPSIILIFSPIVSGILSPPFLVLYHVHVKMSRVKKYFQNTQKSCKYLLTNDTF